MEERNMNYVMTSPIWPTTKTTGKIAVFGLEREP